MNTQIGLSLLSIVASLSLMGGAAFAAFTSTATNAGNTFGAGTMVLTINTVAGTSSTGAFAVTNGTPGQSTSQRLTLKNTGSTTAGSVKVASIAVGGSSALADVLTIQFYNDANDNNIFDSGETSLGSGHLTDPSWTNYTLPGVTLAGGGTYNLAAVLTFDSSAPDAVQGASTTFNMALQASQ